MRFETIAQYDEEIDLVANELADIKGQLEKAMAEQKDTGEYADPQWFRKAKAAARYKGAEHQNLLREKAILTREQKKLDQLSFEKSFIEAARQLLSKKDFSKCFDLAKSLSSID